MPDQSRRTATYPRSPRTGLYNGVPGYRQPEKSLNYCLELENRRTQQVNDTISWLNDIFSIR